MKTYITCLCALLTACTTPETILKNNNEEYVSCGGSSAGSILGGAIGYHIQKNNDEKCVVKYMKNGFSIVNKNENN